MLLAFVRSGYIALGLAQARGAGENGCSWSRAIASSTRIDVLVFSPSDVYPSSGFNRYDGLSLRCLYPGSA